MHTDSSPGGGVMPTSSGTAALDFCGLVIKEPDTGIRMHKVRFDAEKERLSGSFRDELRFETEQANTVATPTMVTAGQVRATILADLSAKLRDKAQMLYLLMHQAPSQASYQVARCPPSIPCNKLVDINLELICDRNIRTST